MRADCVVRDHKKGILGAQIRAGLSHILIGVERAEDDNLKGWTNVSMLVGLPSSRSYI